MTLVSYRLHYIAAAQAHLRQKAAEKQGK